jgi:hypothetical protein
MSALLDFFAGGTARIQALLYAAIAMLVVVLALVVYGEYWRAQAWKARDQVDQGRAQLVSAVDQEKVLAGAVDACNAGVEATRATAAAAVAQAGAALDELKPLIAAHGSQVKRLEDLIKKPPLPGAGCHEAWRAIEAQRSAGAVR